MAAPAIAAVAGVRAAAAAAGRRRATTAAVAAAAFVVFLGPFLVLLFVLFLVLLALLVLFVFFVFLVPLAAAGVAPLLRVGVQGGLFQLNLPFGSSESPGQGCAGMQQQAGAGRRGRRTGSMPRQPASLLAATCLSGSKRLPVPPTELEGAARRCCLPQRFPLCAHHPTWPAFCPASSGACQRPPLQTVPWCPPTPPPLGAPRRAWAFCWISWNSTSCCGAATVAW